MSLPKLIERTRFGAPQTTRRPSEAYALAAPTTYGLFTVTGFILILELSATVTVVMPAGAKTIAVRAGAVAMDNTAYDLVNNAAGLQIIVQGAVGLEIIISALSAASNTTGTMPWVMTPGAIDFILTTNPTDTGELAWTILWQPLSKDATVVVT